MTYVPNLKATQPVVAAAIPAQAITGGATVLLSFVSGVRETAYAVTLTQNCSITVVGGVTATDQVMTIDLIQGGAGGFSPSFGNVSWSGGISPAFNTAPGKQDMVQVRAVGSDVMGWPVSMGRLPLVPSLPAAPSGILVSAGTNQNTINASAVTAYPAVTGYNVYAGASAGGETAVPIASNVALPYVDTGLVAGVARFYRVAAVNSFGIGGLSVEASGTPSSTGALPAAPAGVLAVGANGSVTISAGAVTAVPAVTGYTILRGTTAGGESATPIATNVALPYVDMGVSNGTTYFYTVAAVNAVGKGAASSEVSATPVAPVVASPAHYVSFTGVDNVIYTSPNAAFNPGANPFDMQAHVRMANWSTSGYGGSGETCLWGCWDVNVANRLWRLGLTTTGAVRASWAAAAGTDFSVVSSAAVSAAGGTDLWIRAVVTPTAGTVLFYTSVDGATWTQLGAPQTASGTGAVYTPSTLPYLVIGANASGGSSGNAAEQFAGRFYEARLYVNGVLITDPVAAAGAVSDGKGFSYAISGASSV